MLKVAFVGMGRNPGTFKPEYTYNFVRYHLELPFYYQKFSNSSVTLTFPSDPKDYLEDKEDCEKLFLCSESEFISLQEKFDVVIHWRKWFEHLYRPEAINVILSQDHSYGQEWKQTVITAYKLKKLTGILVFPEWHKKNTLNELNGELSPFHLFDGMTLGVDTDIFYPERRDPHQLLWASDPGRGLDQLIPIFLQLRQKGPYELNITWPDYVKKEDLVKYSGFFKMPGVNVIGQIPNDEKLWKLFRDCGILPYTSTFPEPSSRCHRQAMACGSLVLYPPNMGTPSDLLKIFNTGIVENPITWASTIDRSVRNGSWYNIGNHAARDAKLENWEIQAKKFESWAKGLLNDKH